MKGRPLSDKVLIQQLEKEKTTKGGIVLPEIATEKPLRGKIILVGPGKALRDGTVGKMHVKKGDIVLFPRYAGEQVKIDDREYIIMRESDILMVL